jgi:hypothetical protein
MRVAKAALALAALLLVAPRTFAQDAPNSGPLAFYDDSNNFYYPDNNFYTPANNLYPSSGVIESSSYGTVQPEEISAAVNDGQYIPSTFMDFDDAVALGNDQLALQQVSTRLDTAAPSFADVARQEVTSSPPAPQSTALVQQDTNGNVLVCSDAGDACQPLS